MVSGGVLIDRSLTPLVLSVKPVRSGSSAQESPRAETKGQAGESVREVEITSGEQVRVEMTRSRVEITLGISRGGSVTVSSRWK